MTERRKKFVADFETTTEEHDCRVWGYGIMNIFNHRSIKIGNDMNQFMMILENIKADVYFHNLKFDGSFILNWLHQNGWEYSDIPQPMTYNTTISNMGQWYKIQIVYGMNGNGRPIHTSIYDSLKKIPFPVRDVAKAFNLETMKGDIDYTTYRPPGHTITREEYDYIYNDIHIMAQALREQFSEGLISMTAGSDALKDFKNIINKKVFDKKYPVLTHVVDNDIRKAYRGGFTWLNKRYAEKELGEGVVFDVNSLYPAMMYDNMLPYDLPVYFKGEYEYDEDYPIYIQHIRTCFTIKENHIPTVQIKKHMMFSPTDYLESSDGMEVDLYMTNIDLKLFLEHYDTDYLIYESGWKFKAEKGIFKDYIDKWTEVKVNHEGGKRTLAKLMLNSLYGKFATNPDVTPKIPEFEDDTLHLVIGDEEMKDPVYTAMGVFITSYAREYTIRTAQKCYDRIIYCDTDSIHLDGADVPDAIKDIVDQKKLGMWKNEGVYKRGKYLRAKTYIHEFEDGFLDVKCAGMTDNIKDNVTFDNFNVGFSSYGKLLPKQVPGGVVLVDTVFTII